MKVQIRCFCMMLASLSAVSIFVSCAKLQDTGINPARAESNALFMYPHSQTWAAEHMQFAMKQGATSVSSKPGAANSSHSKMPVALKQCLGCHSGDKQAKALNVSCGATCHASTGETIKPVLPKAGVETKCSECHDQGTSERAHYPVAAGQCAICHQASAQHTDQMGDGPVTTVSDNCTGCHSSVIDKPKVHAAMESGCIQCHDAHDGKEQHLLKGKPAELCVACHEQKPANPDSYHGENRADGSCISCHQPHASENAKLLKANCTDCHSSLTSGQSRVHEALEMEKGCFNCHNPHDSHPKLLRGTAETLCTSCHNNDLASNPIPAGAVSVHGVIKQEGSCWNCHTPHAAGNQHLLKPAATCLNCHSKEIKVSDRRTIPNMKEKIETALNSHPAMGMECSECHKPHASEFVRLLNAKYSVGPYGEYLDGDEKTNTYGLCFKCHDKSMLDAAVTETAFRKDTPNGQLVNRKNLHAVHVANTQGTTGAARGRSCSICHDVHGTTQDKMIRTATGPSNTKLNFALTEQGGSCTVSCHGANPKPYERIN